MDIRTAAYQDLMQMSELIADAIIKKTSPRKDDVSTLQAYSEYGRYWVQKMEQEGRIHAHAVGHKKVFSRHELDTLRAVERTYANIITNEQQ